MEMFWICQTIGLEKHDSTQFSRTVNGTDMAKLYAKTCGNVGEDSADAIGT